MLCVPIRMDPKKKIYKIDNVFIIKIANYQFFGFRGLTLIYLKSDMSTEDIFGPHYFNLIALRMDGKRSIMCGQILI